MRLVSYANLARFLVWSWLGLMAITLLVLPACASAQSDLSDLEAQAYALDRQIMCPVCPSETLNQSQTALAKQMRFIVRQRLADGQSPDDIKRYFASVYGDSVLAEPPTSGVGLVVWIVPPLFLGAGLIVFAFTLRSMKNPSSRATLTRSRAGRGARQMKNYLAAVDEELGPDSRLGKK